MATQNKPVLGYRQCPDCGTQATIHQADGKRKQLYQRCECGCNQTNGKLAQSRFWFETAWLDGLEPETAPVAAYEESDYKKALSAMYARYEKAGQIDRGSRESQGVEGLEESGIDTEIKPELESENSDDNAVQDEPEKSRKGMLWGALAVSLGLIAMAVRG